MAIQDDPRVREFEHQINEKIVEQVNFISLGKCSTFDDYKRRCGIIKGLEMSLETLTEVLKTYGKEDDDE